MDIGFVLRGIGGGGGTADSVLAEWECVPLLLTGS